MSKETTQQRDNRRREENKQARQARRTAPDPAVRAQQNRQDADWGRAALKSRIESV